MTAKTSKTAPKMQRRSKWLIAVGSVVVVYTVVGFLVVPAVVKSQMLKILPGLTKRQVSVDRVKCNPYVLSLTIDGFSLKETNGDVFSSFGELYVNFQLSSIFKRAFVFDEISLKDPFAQVTYLTSGSFNFANLIGNTTNSAPGKPQPPPPLIVYHLSITNGAVAFDDFTRKTPFHTRYQPINISLADFTTRRDESSPYEITARGDSGESLSWSGNITLSPLHSAGAFRLAGLKLPKYKPYSSDYALFEIVDGQVDAAVEYRYDSTTNAMDLDVTNASVSLTRFQLKTPDTGEEVVNIPSFTISNASASLVNHTVEVGEVKSSGGALLVRQNQDGKINLLANLVPQPASAAANPAPASGAPWMAKIDEIAFDDYRLKAEDKVPAKTARFNISQLNFTAKNVSNVSNAPVAVTLSLRLQDTGSVSVKGDATLLPPSADFQIGLSNLDMRMIQPYLDQQVHMAITRGALDVNGRARFRPGVPDAPLVNFDGDVAVRNFGVTDEVQFDDLVTWDALDLTGIHVQLQPNKFHVDRIKFTDAKNSAIIGPDHRLNVLTILPEKKAAPAKTNATPPPGTLPEMTLGEFVFENSSLHFADKSIEPNCVFDVQQASGSVKNISSLLADPSVVEVKGKVDEFSTFSVTGKLNPMPNNLFVDVSVAFTNTILTAFSPYMEKYAGRPLQKGKLSLALHYAIKQKALDAANDIFIDQLTLGPKNGSTNATTLPVKLAIALLKDRSGRIKLDVPVQGKLDDPKFKLAPIIWGVVENLIVKAATSPFSLLGAMFGGGEELSFVAFDPGQSVVPAVETKKLDTLVQALYDRPELTMEINGSADTAKDRDEMVHAKFQRQIKALFIKEMTDAGKPAIAEDELTLPTADFARLVPVAYSNAFGAYRSAATNETTNAPVPPPPVKPAAPVAIIQPLSSPPRTPFEHGGSRMMYFTHRDEDVTKAAPPPPVIPPVETNTPPAVAPVVVAQSDLAAMEDRLLQQIKITDDDYRQLMENRAKEVEAYLLKSGKVTADRLFITAPKPIVPDARGEDRVNLTLD